MSENKYQLLTIGAAWSSSFGSVDPNSASKIKRVGRAIKDLKKLSVPSDSAVESISHKYNSLSIF